MKLLRVKLGWECRAGKPVRAPAADILQIEMKDDRCARAEVGARRIVMRCRDAENKTFIEIA